MEPKISRKSEVYKIGDMEVEITRKADGVLETVSFGRSKSSLSLVRLTATDVRTLKKLAEMGVLSELER